VLEPGTPLTGATGVTEAAATHADEAKGATVTVVATVTLGLAHEPDALEAAATGETGLPLPEPPCPHDALDAVAVEADTTEEVFPAELLPSQSPQVTAPVVVGSTGFLLVDVFEASQSAQSKLEVVVAGSTDLVLVEDSQSAQSKAEVVVTGSTGLVLVDVFSQSAQSKLDDVVAGSTGLVLVEDSQSAHEDPSQDPYEVVSGETGLLDVLLTQSSQVVVSDEP
jgi:hypothetical protein